MANDVVPAGPPGAEAGTAVVPETALPEAALPDADPAGFETSAVPSPPEPSARRVRARLARLGVPRGAGLPPVLEPLVRTIRSTHP